MVYIFLFTSFFKLEGFNDKPKWYAEIMNYGLNRPPDPYPTIHQIFEFYGDKEELSLDEQFGVLSAIPNLHQWASKSNSGVKMHQCFTPHGMSPRNMILNELEDIDGSEDHFLFIKKLVALVLNQAFKIVQLPERNSYQKKVYFDVCGFACHNL